MKNPRFVTLLLSTLAICVFGVSIASAGGKAFVPKTGKYSGTYTTSLGTVPSTGTVEKTGGKYLVQAGAASQAKCSDGTILSTVPLGVQAPVKGKTFTVSQEVNVASGAVPMTFVVKLSGHFTSEKAFTGTVSGESTPLAGSTTSPTCTTGTVSFSLKRK
jgi:hypothetical protein